MRKIRIAVFAAALALGVQTGCGAGVENNKTASQQESPEEAKEELAPGDRIAGFTLESVEEISAMQGQLLTFTHEKSGARLGWIRNSDPEMAFGIYYRTPMLDESDVNHVLEHSILSSSPKYPSSNLFFDLANKSYNTYINAFTYNTFTGYPFVTKSQEQFILMMDAYLSCMTEPGILTNENIFKREALRYELYDAEQPITITGTVYSEDFGALTGIWQESFNNTVDALYPGEIASNQAGRAHRNYQDLSYESVLETYHRWYHFDNSLILLYGDLDYEETLTFLDNEYLSAAEKSQTDMSAYKAEAAEPRMVEITASCPAYEGDTVENASIIEYAIDLSDIEWTELTKWGIMAGVMNQENSVFMKTLREQGISSPCYVELDMYGQKPCLIFALQQCQPEDSHDFHEAVISALQKMEEHGIEEEVLDSVLKQYEMSYLFTRDRKNMRIDVLGEIANYWTHTGELNYHVMEESMLAEAKADREQNFVKRLSGDALQAKRTALVTTVPEPGLAEEIIARRDQYLEQMKAGMSSEEIEEMIRRTEEFNTWNGERNVNEDFIIDPMCVPEAEPVSYKKSEEGGVTFYQAPADVEKVGSYSMYLDAGRLSNQDLSYLNLYQLLFGQIGTKEQSSDEVRTLYMNLFYGGVQFSELYSEDGEAGAGRPMTVISWSGLTDDFEESIDALLDLWSNTDVENSEEILEIVQLYKDYYDPGRTEEPMEMARNLSKAWNSRNVAYSILCQSPEMYRFLNEVEEGLTAGGDYAAELAVRLKEIREKLLTRQNLIFSCAASEESLDRICEIAKEKCSSMPEGTAGEPLVVLPEKVQRLGVAVESSNQYTAAGFSLYGSEQFEGRYLPFLTAVSDLYLIPTIRFQNGAYSAGIRCDLFSGLGNMYSYSDPNAGKTLDVMKAAGSYLKETEISQKSLEGYILQSLSNMELGGGVLSRPITAMDYEIRGYDIERAMDAINDMRNASVEDQAGAVVWIDQMMDNAGYVTVGNEEVLKAEQEAYDQVISYKSASGEK